MIGEIWCCGRCSALFVVRLVAGTKDHLKRARLLNTAWAVHGLTPRKLDDRMDRALGFPQSATDRLPLKR